MIVEESKELVVSREITPLTDRARELLPLAEIARTEMIVTHPEFRITDDHGEQAVNGYMRLTSTWADKVANFWKPYKNYFHVLHKAACDAEAQTAPAIANIRKACDKAMKEWIRHKEAEARAKQKYIESMNEKLRKSTEAEARKAVLNGDVSKAEQLYAEANSMRSPVLIQEPTKLDGTAIKDVWRAEVTDPMALIKAVAEGRIPLMQSVKIKGKDQEVPLLVINETVLNFFAGKLGATLDWPGVEVKKDLAFAARKL
jgi:hypothetical protein